MNTIINGALLGVLLTAVYQHTFPTSYEPYRSITEQCLQDTQTRDELEKCVGLNVNVIQALK